MRTSKLILSLSVAHIFCLFISQTVFCQSKNSDDAVQTAAQTSRQAPCTNADAYQKVGGWSKQGQDSLANADPGFPKELYKPILAKAQKAAELLKQANPQPIGIQAMAYRSINNHSYTANGALKFRVTGMYFNFYCELDTPGDSERGKIFAA